MTRDDIIAEAARRLGDASTEFLQQISLAFDYVLGDLAANEVIGDLRQSNETATLVKFQRNYSTRTLAGLTAPDYPSTILSLRVWAFSVDPITNERFETAPLIEQVDDTTFERQRAIDGEEFFGRPIFWRLWPNSRQVQLHPVPDETIDGLAIECLFLAPTDVLSGSDDIDQIRREDLETIVYGLKARMAPFLDETQQDPQNDWQLYMQGRDRMWARAHNRGIGTIVPVDQ